MLLFHYDSPSILQQLNAMTALPPNACTTLSNCQNLEFSGPSPEWQVWWHRSESSKNKITLAHDVIINSMLEFFIVHWDDGQKCSCGEVTGEVDLLYSSGIMRYAAVKSWLGTWSGFLMSGIGVRDCLQQKVKPHGWMLLNHEMCQFTDEFELYIVPSCSEAKYCRYTIRIFHANKFSLVLVLSV